MNLVKDVLRIQSYSNYKIKNIQVFDITGKEFKKNLL